jgi:hypothetical protein
VGYGRADYFWWLHIHPSAVGSRQFATRNVFVWVPVDFVYLCHFILPNTSYYSTSLQDFICLSAILSCSQVGNIYYFKYLSLSYFLMQMMVMVLLLIDLLILILSQYHFAVKVNLNKLGLLLKIELRTIAYLTHLGLFYLWIYSIGYSFHIFFAQYWGIQLRPPALLFWDRVFLFALVGLSCTPPICASLRSWGW